MKRCIDGDMFSGTVSVSLFFRDFHSTKQIVLCEKQINRYSTVVYMWIPTDSGVNPGGADRDPSDVWARGAIHSSIFNMDRTCAIVLICRASLPS